MKFRSASLILTSLGSCSLTLGLTFHAPKQIKGSASTPQHASQVRVPTQLCVKRKGSLRKSLDISSVDEIPSTKVKRTKTKNKGKNKTKSTQSGGSVSPSLAQWAASNKSSSTEAIEDTPEIPPVDESDRDTVAEYTSFKKTRKGKKNNTSERRARQTQRQKEENEMRLMTQSIILDLEDLLDVESNRDIDAILEKVRALTDVNQGKEDSVTSSMKILCAGQKRRDYRMIWAGSDDALCHLGTGLHKVPLARLQEVFVTLGKSRVEMYEVIRILGPFPNVKNTLKGDVTTMKPSSSSQSTLRVSYDSMIDGTGKEILSGKVENVRTIELKTRFASEDIIVCETPTAGKEEENMYEDGFGVNGSNLLIFALEADMDIKMEALRVG